MNDEVQQPKTSTQTRMINSTLLVIVLAVGAIAYKTLETMVFLMGARYYEANLDNPERIHDALVRLDEIWVLLGGGAFLIFCIVVIEYHVKRIPTQDTRRVLLITLAVEFLLIAIGRVLSVL
jgi:hypothetical protein